MKFVFALTPGRTGSAYLAELLKHNISDAEVHHEQLGYTSFGVDTPDISHLHAYNTFGNTQTVQDFWKQKMDRMLACGKSCFAETSHILMKAGLVENMALLGEGHEFHFVILKRDIFKTMLSYHRRGDFLNMGSLWMWYLDPYYAKNLTKSAPFLPYGSHGMMLWYINEISVRLEVFRLLYAKQSNFHFHTVNLPDLNREEGAADLFKRLGLFCSGIKIPPEQNVNLGDIPLDDESKARLKQFVDGANLDPVALARMLVPQS